MRKLMTLLLLLVFFLQVPLYASTDTASLTAEQKKVKKKIDDANAQIMSYEKDINKMKAKIDDNDAKISELNKEKKSNEDKLNASKNEVSSTLLVMQKMNNANTIATYFYDENTLDNNYFLKLDNINTMFDSVSSNVGVFIKAVEDTQKDINDINDLKAKNQTELDKMNSKLDEQKTLETSLKQELADIQEKIGKVAVTVSPSGGAVGSNKQSIMSAAGISSGDYQYVDYIIKKESGWRSTAANPMSSAYGLCQALPGGKMASAGGDWQTNPVTQMKWCNSYATSRYGSWAGAYNFWISHHWW